MGHELQHILGIQRLACFGGVVFAVVIMFQYFEFPYGDVISSLFSASRQIPNTGSYPPEKLYPFPQVLGNNTRIDGANGTEPTNVLVTGIGTERKGELDDFIDMNGSGVSGNQVVAKQNLMRDKVEQNDHLVPEKARESSNGFSTDNANHSTFWEKGSDAGPTPMPTPNLLGSNTSIPDRDASNSVQSFKEHEASPRAIAPLANVSSVTKFPRKKQKGNVVSISQMYDILVHNRASSHSMKPRWSSTADQELMKAKLQIENAPINENDHMLYPSLFRNISIFRRSYELMEKTLKVYIYKEGEKPIFHQPRAVLGGIYASEGWFMKHMTENKHFVTYNPKQAHLFYIPFSSRMLEEKLYIPGSHSRKNLVQYLKNYLHMIAGRYDFWNRTGGSDHFLVACHDWATDETRKSMDTCIRALCNSDVKREGFELGKDVSLPETYVRSSENPLGELGGKTPSQRSILAFFAGRMHGDVRPILLQHWENKDPDMKICGKLQKSKNNRSYIQYMKSSKYCICAKGYEVNSPRVVEAIFYECVPVIISDNFVPPFFEILNWESFSVFIQEKDIPNLKNILLSISKRRYLVMQQRVKKERKEYVLTRHVLSCQGELAG